MHIISAPSVPYWGHIPETIHPGTVIQVDGHVPHHCHKFEFNLYCGHEFGHHAEKHSDIALQIRPKIHGRKVILNSRRCGDWGHKQKLRDVHHIHHGSPFSLQIVVEQQDYRVMMNGHVVGHFHHRVPLHEVRIFNIEGHLDVHRIEYRHAGYTPGYTPGVTPAYPAVPTAPIYPSAPPAYPPGVQPAYPATGAYPGASVYPPPAPGVYVPPVISTPYVPPTVIIEEGHHHHHHGHHGGLIGGLTDAVFGHHHDHHHGHHGHHGHHW